MREPESDFVISGDLHGKFDQAKLLLTKTFDLGLDTIVQLGDFGNQYDDYFLDNVQRYLQAFDINLYFVDGNHENFEYLYEQPIIEDGTRLVRDNIFHLPRGFRFIWKDISFLAMGGAASINKKNIRHWYEEEAITREDIMSSHLAGQTDVIFMHDSPIEAPNSICDDEEKMKLAMKINGPMASLYANLHRSSLQKVVDIVEPRLMFHGHYHKAMNYKYRRANGQWVKIWGLDQGNDNTTYGSMFRFNFSNAKKDITLLKVKDHAPRTLH